MNICKIADSPLGVKRKLLFSINLSKAIRGKKNKKIASSNIKANTNNIAF